MKNQQRIEAVLEEARSGNSWLALVELEVLMQQGNHTQVMAWLGYCLAKEKREFSRALVLCTSAVDASPDNSDLYLALARVCLLTGRRYQALSVLRKGLKLGRNELIVKELTSMGLRGDPVFSFFDRANPINIMAGRVLTHLGFR